MLIVAAMCSMLASEVELQLGPIQIMVMGHAYKKF